MVVARHPATISGGPACQKGQPFGELTGNYLIYELACLSDRK
jgi:hypothetical protein